MSVLEKPQLRAELVESAPTVFAVTLNWNRPQDTLACLDSLRRQQPVAPKLLVVDNGSTDESVELIRSAYADVELLETGRNLGFAAGFNVGIRYALKHGAEYIFLVNNDTVAHPSMLAQLLSSATATVGIVAPAIFYADQPDCIWSVGGAISPWLLEMTDHHGRGQPMPTAPVERDFLSGCALLVRREVFEQIGLFDENFFMYYEDLDFCLRARRQGYRLLLVPQARLWHQVSQSSGGADSPMERFYMALNSGRYFRKHMRGWQYLTILPHRALSALRWTLRLMWRRDGMALKAYWRGLLKGWLGN